MGVSTPQLLTAAVITLKPHYFIESKAAESSRTIQLSHLTRTSRLKSACGAGISKNPVRLLPADEGGQACDQRLHI